METPQIGECLTFAPGDRVRSRIGTLGIVQEPLWLMPNHTLVRFDTGVMVWVLTSILEPAPDAPAPPSKPSQKRPKRPKNKG